MIGPELDAYPNAGTHNARDLLARAIRIEEIELARNLARAERTPDLDAGAERRTNRIAVLRAALIELPNMPRGAA